MRNMIYNGSVRRRRLLLAVVAPVAVLLAAVRLAADPDGGVELAAGLVNLLLMLATMGMAVAASRAPRPAGLAVEPAVPAFEVRIRADDVLNTVALWLFAAHAVSGVRPEPDRGWLPVLYAIAAVIVTPAAVLNLVRVWRGVRLRLRPDGLYQPGLAGSLTVPWQALTPGHPLPAEAKGSLIALTIARPELVRRRGLGVSRRLLNVGPADRQLLTDVIRHYADQPDRRPAIGTEAEYRRLLADLRG